MTQIYFAKFHGLGNDFIVSTGLDVGITRRGVNPSSTGRLQRLARSICDRHAGVGADGFVVVLAPQRKANHARIRFFNADGSEAEMSGNGIRCAAAYYLERARHRMSFMPGRGTACGTLPPMPEQRVGQALPLTLKLETAAGVKSVRSEKAGSGTWVFRVGMGEPIVEPRKIPFGAPKVATPVVGFLLPTSQGTLPVTVTSMGNPHCSTFVADFDGIDWQAAGNEIEKSQLFPKRTNVEFIKVRSRNEIEVRFWERGVGQTASSGTGSCGAVVACVLNGLTDRQVRVRTVGGILEVNWPRNGEVTLTGSVELISHGVYFYTERSKTASFPNTSLGGADE
jgi:diaminopimelate epimerase